MKIGVISDTHDHLLAVQRGVELLSQANVEMIVHCGDWVAPFTLAHLVKQCQGKKVDLKGVLGNNDGDRDGLIKMNLSLGSAIDLAENSDLLEIMIGQKKIGVTHGHNIGLLNQLLSSKSYLAIFTGHTHKPRIEIINSQLVINPGAMCGIVQGVQTLQGSVAIYDTINNQAKILDFPLI